VACSLASKLAGEADCLVSGSTEAWISGRVGIVEKSARIKDRLQINAQRGSYRQSSARLLLWQIWYYNIVSIASSGSTPSMIDAERKFKSTIAFQVRPWSMLRRGLRDCRCCGACKVLPCLGWYREESVTGDTLFLRLLASAHLFGFEVLIKEIQRFLIRLLAAHDSEHALSSFIMRRFGN
jgi:hypothetical protein